LVHASVVIGTKQEARFGAQRGWRFLWLTPVFSQHRPYLHCHRKHGKAKRLLADEQILRRESSAAWLPRQPASETGYGWCLLTPPLR